MIVRAALRAAAIAIAMLAYIDPVIMRDLPQRPPLTIVTLRSEDVSHAERLQGRLSPNYDVTVQMADPASLAAGCPTSGGCVLVSRGEVPRRLTAGATVIGALRVGRTPEADSPTLDDVRVPHTVHRDGASSIHVTLTRPVARVDVLDGDVLVGSAEPGESLEVDVTWVPLAGGARALRVVAGDDVEDVGVVVETAPAPVFVYEPEPTWSGTFVRRAIEDDPRFAVVGRTRVAPPVTVTRGDGGPLSAAAVGNAAAVVVTAPHALSPADVQVLDRFVTRRGGSLLVIPDQRPAGAVLQLLPRVSGQRRDTQPRAVGPLRVREWLTFEPGAGTAALAVVDGEPVVMSRAIGRGRVIVSGALDAWRFRDDESSFGAFWTGLVWEAAMAAGQPLHLRAEHVLVRPGEPIRVDAELQSFDEVPMPLSASGSMTCGGQREAVRWWPGGRRGTFTSVARPQDSGHCELHLAVGDNTATLALVVQQDVQRGGTHPDALETAVHAHGGVVADIGDGETALIDRASARLPAVEMSTPTSPMRAPYWLIVFAACLGSEWWLRRQAGLS
jgi:hypothetical protein